MTGDTGKFLWWYNNVTGEVFFETTGTDQHPLHATLEKSGGKKSKTNVGDDTNDEQSTEAGDNASTVTTSTGQDSTWIVPTQPPGPGYTGMCTHRTYADNLYTPGQLPLTILEGDSEQQYM